jgi:hypothetical protein
MRHQVSRSRSASSRTVRRTGWPLLVASAEATEFASGNKAVITNVNKATGK